MSSFLFWQKILFTIAFFADITGLDMEYFFHDTYLLQDYLHSSCSKAS